MTDNPSPLRLAYVQRNFPVLSETFVNNEMTAMERLGHSVTVFSINHPADNTWTLVPKSAQRRIIYLDTKGKAEFVKAIVWLLRCHPAGLVKTFLAVARQGHTYLWKLFKQAIILAQAAEAAGFSHLHAHLRVGTDVVWLTNSLTGVSYSFTAHAHNVFVPEKSRYISREIAKAEFVVTVCEFNRSILAKRSPQHSAKIHIIRPFLAGEWYSMARTSHTEMLPGLQALRLISVSRLVPKKGVFMLIEAMRRVIAKGLSVRLSIIGDGPERTPLEALITRHGLEAQVSLLGAKGPADVKSLMESSDCFVLASVQAPDGDSDATPTVLGEAMACGLPVVSTRIAGIPEIVPENAGLLVEPGQIEPLAEAIATIAAMPIEQRRAMGECGRQSVLSHWNAEQDARRLAGLFASAIQGRMSKPAGLKP